MSSLITNATIQIRRDTAGNWTSNNPTPAAGEWCLETDTGRTKLGDGSTAWTSLSYQSNILTYTTGWLLNEIGGAGVGKWDNVHLGDDPSQDSDINHGLSTALSDLIVKLFISTDGTDNNSFEVGTASFANSTTDKVEDYITNQVDADNIRIHTGVDFLVTIADNGGVVAIIAQDWYYKVKIYKLA